MWFTWVTIFSVHKNCFHTLNNVNQTFIDLFCKFFLSVQNNTIIVWFHFNWAKEIGNLLSIWSGVSIFNLCPRYCLLNSRIFSIIFTISFGCLNLISFSDMLLISLLKSVNALLIKTTWISFLSVFLVLFRSWRILSGSWYLKYYLKNYHLYFFFLN